MAPAGRASRLPDSRLKSAVRCSVIVIISLMDKANLCSNDAMGLALSLAGCRQSSTHLMGCVSWIDLT